MDNLFKSGIWIKSLLTVGVSFSFSLAAKPIESIVLLKESFPHPSHETEERYGVETIGLSLPGSKAELKRTLAHFLKKEANSETIKNIKKAIYTYYRAHGYPFIILNVLDQPKNSTVLEIYVIESRLGKVEVQGNRWTPSKRYLEYFRTKPGEKIPTKAVTSDASFLNRNPFREVDVFYKPGKDSNTTDVVLMAKDRKPYLFYVGMDDSGVPTTGRERVFAGFGWDQMFDLDQTLFYQYTTNYNVNRFHSNMIQYMLALPWQAILQLYGGFSSVKATLESPERKNRGTNIQSSLRYITPFLSTLTFAQDMTCGFDFKQTNNNMEYIDATPTFGSTVNLFQFFVGYRMKAKKGANNTQAGAQAFFSPFSWLPNQSNAAYSSIRHDAVNRWIYLHCYWNFEHKFKNSWSWKFDFRGQLSSNALLTSEQLGMGGYNTVRGYDERQYNADNGFLASTELSCPNYSFFKKKNKPRDFANLLVFFDSGLGFDTAKVSGFRMGQYLLGIGPGFRYRIPPYLDVRLDWGIKLHHQSSFTGGWNRLHFSITGSY